MPSAVEEESLRRRIHDDELTTTSVVEADHTVEEERISTVERVELGDISHHDKKNLVQQSYQGVQGVSASVYDETTTKNPDSTHHMGFEVNDTEGDNVDEDNAGQLFMDIRNRAAAADLTDSQEQVITIHGFYHFEFFAIPSYIPPRNPVSGRQRVTHRSRSPRASLTFLSRTRRSH